MVLHYGSFEQTDETCKRACDGTIAIINDFGSTGYLWSNGATTVSIDDLCGGDVYSFTITYGDYCTQGYSQILIGGPDAIDAQCTVTADESGNGAADGSITAINETGGTPPYSYLWSNGETTQAISGLTSGDYTVSVTDSHQCPNDQSTCSVITIPHRLTQSNDDFGKQISISPNPFVNALSINVTSDEALTITVTDAMGRVVNQYNNVQQSLKMNGDWHNGIYLIRVENTSGSFRKTLKAARVE